MADKVPTYYWDACLFYEWLNEEPTTPFRRRAMQRLLADNVGNKNVIVTSTITHIEVLPEKLPPDKEATYFANFDGVRIAEHNMDVNVVRLARYIRNYYFRPPTAGGKAKMMDAADSIHLATAVILGVDEFHTRDDDRKGTKIPLVSLYEWSGDPKLCGKYDLKIVCPEDHQTDITDFIDQEPDAR
jgi:hypothetical protein